MEVALEPIISYAVEILAVVLMAVGSWGIKTFADNLGLDKEGKLVDFLNGALDEAVHAARKRLQESGNDTDVTIRNEAVGEAVQYVVDMAPKTLKKLGYDSAKVRRMIENRLD